MHTAVPSSNGSQISPSGQLAALFISHAGRQTDFSPATGAHSQPCAQGEGAAGLQVGVHA